MKTECPHCNQRYDIDDEAAGHEVTCQKCGQSFFVGSQDVNDKNDDQERINTILAKYGDILNRCRSCGKKVDTGAKFCSNCDALTASPGPNVSETIKCQNCNQNVPIGSFCQNCGAMLSECNLTTCPDCGQKVSVLASICSGCGRPLVPKTIKMNVMNEFGPGVGVMLIFFGFFSCFLGLVNPAFFFSSPFFIIIGVFCLVKYRLKITCQFCGFQGVPVCIKGPSNCIGCLLFLVGIIPGFVYLLFAEREYKCPQCGALVK